MSKRLGQTPFRELLPSSIADDVTIGRIADSLDGPLNKAARAIPDLLIFSRLGHDAGTITPARLLAPLERLAALSGGLAALPEEALDLLAWQFHVERYESAVSLAAKRAMVFSSVILHRKRGTPWAVKHGLETTLQVPVEISEWFDYGGEPYFFRVTLDVSGASFDARASENAIKVIFAHKNVRSWLEYLRTKSVRKLSLTIGAGGVHATCGIAFTLRQNLDAPDLPVYAGVCCVNTTRSFILCQKERKASRQSRFFTGLTIYPYTRSVIHVANR